MRGAFTKYPDDMVDTVQLNAGFITDDFDPDTLEIGNILGATADGITFASNPTFEDFGADVDNVPPNTWQLKRLQSWNPTCSGTYKTMTQDLGRDMLGAGAFGTSGSTVDKVHIIPADKLTASDFKDVWILGDYSAANVGTGAGYMAIHLKNALNDTGFQWKTNKDGKADFAFNYRAHYDLSSPDDPPFEIYIKPGTAA